MDSNIIIILAIIIFIMYTSNQNNTRTSTSTTPPPPPPRPPPPPPSTSTPPATAPTKAPPATAPTKAPPAIAPTPPPAYTFKTKKTIIPGQLRQVSIDNNVVCGTLNSNEIYCKDQELASGGSDWKKIPGLLSHVSVSNGKLIGISPGSTQIYYANDYKNINWLGMPGGLIQVDIDGNVVCGTNAAGQMYCKDGDLASTSGDSDWKLLSTTYTGKLKHVSVSNGKLVAVNESDEIFYADNYKNVNWVKIRGALTQVDIDGEVVCGVNSSYQTFCRDNILEGDWVRMDGDLSNISVSKGNIFGIVKGSTIINAYI